MSSRVRASLAEDAVCSSNGPRGNGHPVCRRFGGGWLRCVEGAVHRLQFERARDGDCPASSQDARRREPSGLVTLPPRDVDVLMFE